MNKTIVSCIIVCLLSTTSIAIVNSVNCRPYIYVDDDNIQGPWYGTLEHPYRFIQDGIDNASSGDTIFVFSGIYYECLEIGKSINLIGENKDSAIITEGVEISFIDHVKVSGFKIKGTFLVNEVSDVAITKNIITDISNDESFVYGIKLNGYNNTIADNTITNIESLTTRGHVTGINLKGSYNTVTANTITDLNDEAYGLYVSGSYNAVTDNTITDLNEKSIGIYIGWSSNSTIIGNTITNIVGIGVWIKGSHHSTIKDNIITNIADDFFAVGINVFLSSHDIIEGNIIANVNGGSFSVGVALDASSNITITGNDINKVQSIFNGYGIYLMDSTCNFITHNNFIDNSECAGFLFTHYLEEEESFNGGEIPDSFDETKINSTNWDQNYWNRPKLLPKTILGKLEVYSYDGALLGVIILYNYDLNPLSKISVVSQTAPSIQQSISQQPVISYISQTLQVIGIIGTVTTSR